MILSSRSRMKSREDACDPWRRFVMVLAVAAAGLLCAFLALVFAADPFGTRVRAGRTPTAIMDLNGRYMFPQLARSGLFDSAVFGTSTLRLLDPAVLDGNFGGRFANLGLNAGTPWEQMELAKLFVRHAPAPGTLIFGLDRNWCDPAADAHDKRVTFRSFPPWLYDETWLNDVPAHLSLKSLEIAGRVALHALGRMPERIRRDGYEVFTPPEDRYDLARARSTIWSEAGPGRGAKSLERQAEAEIRFPALAWLDDLIGSLKPGARVVLVLPPIHVAAQAAPGSTEEVVERACKAALTAIGKRREALTVDFRLPTAVTREDSNYWDSLHYRQPIAGQIVLALRAAFDGFVQPDGFYAVLTPPRR